MKRKIFCTIFCLVSLATSCYCKDLKDIFNPWVNQPLESMRHSRHDARNVYKAQNELGLITEDNKKEIFYNELYPILFGSKNSDNEFIFVLTELDENAHNLWNTLKESLKYVEQDKYRIVLFAAPTLKDDVFCHGLLIASTLFDSNLSIHIFNSWLEKRSKCTIDDNTLVFFLPLLKTIFPDFDEQEAKTIGIYAWQASTCNALQCSFVKKKFGIEHSSVILNGYTLSSVEPDAVLKAMR